MYLFLNRKGVIHFHFCLNIVRIEAVVQALELNEKKTRVLT